jgi:hypothetical protein
MVHHLMAQNHPKGEQAATQDCQGCGIITVGFPFAVGALKVLEPYAGKLAQLVPFCGIRFLGGVSYPVVPFEKKPTRKQRVLSHTLLFYLPHDLNANYSRWYKMKTKDSFVHTKISSDYRIRDTTEVW